MKESINDQIKTLDGLRINCILFYIKKYRENIILTKSELRFII